MNGALQLAASNAVVAALAAVVVLGVTRTRRNPHLAHLLWALVLVKLVTPPVLSLAIPVFSTSPLPQAAASPAENVAAASPAAELAQAPAAIESDAAESDAVVGSNEIADSDAVARDNETAERDPSVWQRQAGDLAIHSVTKESPAAGEWVDDGAQSLPADGRAAFDRPSAADWRIGLVGLWAAGTALWLGLLAVRAVRFNRLVRAMPPAPEAWQQELAALAARLGLHAWPGVRLAEGAISPLLWTIGARPVIVLPRALVERLDSGGHRALLAHELAHYYRRDHWLRWLEMLVLAVHWWNPVAWWACRQLRVAEERCCDAWAVWLLDGEARFYGQTLLATIDFLSAARCASPLGASGMSASGNLKGRFEMILQTPFGRRLSWRTRLIVAATALVVLPWSLSAMRVGAETPAPAEPEPKAEAQPQPETPPQAAAETQPQAAPENQPQTKAEWGPNDATNNTDEITALGIKGDAAQATLFHKSYEVVSIDGVPIKQILDDERQQYGELAKQYSAVIESEILLRLQGAAGDWRKLVLRDPKSGETKTLELAVRPGAVPRWSKLSPFTAMRVRESTADVEFEGKFYDLESIDGLPTKAILEVARRSSYTQSQIDIFWEKRVVEDIVEVMAHLGHRPGETVKLVLYDRQSGETKTVEHAPLTHENRAKAREARNNEQAWAKLSPFSGVHLRGETAADVKFEGKFYELVSIDDLPTKELLEGARYYCGDLWQKRFVLDVGEVMDRMGYRPGSTVKLVLRDPQSGETKTVDRAPMIAANRPKAPAAQVRPQSSTNRNWEGQLGGQPRTFAAQPPISGPVQVYAPTPAPTPAAAALPLSNVRVSGDEIDVFFEGHRHQLLRIGGMSAKEILDGARELGPLWEKRVVEDLAGVVRQLGHDPNGAVTLEPLDPNTLSAAEEKQIRQAVESFAKAAEKTAKLLQTIPPGDIEVEKFAKGAEETDRGALAQMLGATNLNGVTKALAAGARIDEVRCIIPLPAVPQAEALAVTDFFDLGLPAPEGKQCVVYHCVRQDDRWLIRDITMEGVDGFVARLRIIPPADAPIRRARAMLLGSQPGAVEGAGRPLVAPGPAAAVAPGGAPPAFLPPGPGRAPSGSQPRRIVPSQAPGASSSPVAAPRGGPGRAPAAPAAEPVAPPAQPAKPPALPTLPAGSE